MSEQKPTFNNTLYSAFQNDRATMEELHIFLTPNKEHQKVFPKVPLIWFWNDKRVKNFLVRATLPVLNERGRYEPCGKKLV